MLNSEQREANWHCNGNSIREYPVFCFRTDAVECKVDQLIWLNQFDDATNVVEELLEEPTEHLRIDVHLFTNFFILQSDVDQMI